MEQIRNFIKSYRRKSLLRQIARVERLISYCERDKNNARREKLRLEQGLQDLEQQG